MSKISSPIEQIRHSLAHLLAAAVMELYPDAKRAIGPAIDNGFYFDFQFAKPISDADLPNIEKKMRQILPTWDQFTRHELSASEAKKQYPKNQFKHELIDEFSKETKKITFYKSGEYWDLCKGGHVQSMKEINPDTFKLTHLAGAYWRGDEKKPMLTRIYGLAFASKKELAEYEQMLVEAKKRDHKKLGIELDLFTFSDLVGAGLPLWTPKGTVVRELLDNFVWELRRVHGYQKVEIPHITKKDLYEASGHWDKFQDELLRIKTREQHEFAMKPMNCPHHTQIFARRPHSYREMPQRYANTTMVYRDEQTGELSGLSRVRSITQDDAHVFCRLKQVQDEISKIWDIVDKFYKPFGFELEVRLSLSDQNHPEKYLGDPHGWIGAESSLKKIMTSRGIDLDPKKNVGLGEAAFYGPKIDFMAKDSLGRQWQVATIQLDMNMPERFDLACVNEKGEKERIVMIHAAIMGSIERFLSILIEHYAGAFPLWLAPVQVVVLPISDVQNKYAEEIAAALSPPREGEIDLPVTLSLARRAGRGLTSPDLAPARGGESRGGESLRIDLDARSESIGKKIRNAEKQKIPYMLIVGKKEVENKTISVRQRGEKDLGAMAIEKFLEKIKKEVAAKATS